MNYERLFIRPDQYQKIKQLAEEQNKTIIEIMDVILMKEEPKEEPTPIITKCMWDFFYWKKTENGWEKINECPVLTTRPDIMNLPPKEWATTLAPLCKICMLKEKAERQKERRKQRKRQYFSEYGTFKTHEYEPDYKLY
jgi:hypothetical protein